MFIISLDVQAGRAWVFFLHWRGNVFIFTSKYYLMVFCLVEKTSGEVGRRGFLLLGISVTPLHPGSGRSLGLVDLTIQRDPLGYPVVFASSVKGALKSLCVRKMIAEKIDRCVDDRGLAKCGDTECQNLNVCCCLFGSEAGGEESEQALVSILDFTLLAMPVPSADTGYVYVTAPVLLRRSSLIAEALGYKADELKEIATLSNNEEGPAGIRIAALEPIASKSRIDIAGSIVSVNKLSINKQLKEGSLINLVKRLGGLAEEFENRLVVVPDEVAPLIIDRGIMRITRVRMRRDRKTVAEGSLWTEEYIPPGAIFVSGLLVTPVKNKFCEKTSMETGKIVDEIAGKLENVLGGSVFYFTVGGKETVGKGLVKVRVHGLESGREGGKQ